LEKPRPPPPLSLTDFQNKRILLQKKFLNIMGICEATSGTTHNDTEEAATKWKNFQTILAEFEERFRKLVMSADDTRS